MKKVLLLAAALCLMISAQAQFRIGKSSENQLETWIKKVEQLNRQTENYTQKLDSMIYQGGLLTVSFQYDNRFNIVKAVMGGFFENVTIEYFYDSQNRLIRTIETYIDGDMDKVEYTYNSQGWVSEMVQYEFENGTWQEEYKTTYQYNNDGNVLVATELDYDEDLGIWENDDKIEYTYQGGRLVSSLKYSYFLDMWHIKYKNEFQYDNQGDCIEACMYENVEGEWYGEERILYTYDANHNCVKEVEYIIDWDALMSGNTAGWVLDSEIVFTYDLSVPSSNVAGLNYLEESIISYHNKLLKVEENYFDEEEPQVPFISLFYYSAVTGFGENSDALLSIWPNPATETLNLNAEGLQQVEIFSMDGKQVMHLENGLESINVNDLAKVCYLLKDTFADGTKAMRKFVKK